MLVSVIPFCFNSDKFSKGFSYISQIPYAVRKSKFVVSVCDISINTSLRTENKNENRLRTLEQNLTKEKGNIFLHPISKCCGSYKNILWIRFIILSSSNNGIMRGPCPSVCPHVLPLILLREFQIKLVLLHRDASPAVKTDKCNCCQFASGVQPASCPVRVGLSTRGKGWKVKLTRHFSVQLRRG